jgi:hypothetical protein
LGSDLGEDRRRWHALDSEAASLAASRDGKEGDYSGGMEAKRTHARVSSYRVDV